MFVETIGRSHTDAKCSFWSLVGKSRDHIIGKPSYPVQEITAKELFPSHFLNLMPIR
jgi:hypothetical protein